MVLLAVTAAGLGQLYPEAGEPWQPPSGPAGHPPARGRRRAGRTAGPGREVRAERAGRARHGDGGRPAVAGPEVGRDPGAPQPGGAGSARCPGSSPGSPEEVPGPRPRHRVLQPRHPRSGRCVRAMKRSTSMFPPEAMTPIRRGGFSTRPASRAARGRGTAGFQDRLQAFEGEAHRGADLVVADEGDGVDQTLVDGEGDLAGVARAWPSAMVRGTGTVTRVPASQGALGVVARLRFDADDTDPRVQRRGGGGAARDEPAASDRHQQGVQRAGLLQEFQRGGALAGDDMRGGRRAGSGSARGPRPGRGRARRGPGCSGRR